MKPLAERLAFLLRKWGADPAVREPDLRALSRLEETDQAAAVARFHELKRAWALARREELRRALRRHAFVTSVPDADAAHLTQREVEREIAWLLPAVAAARDVERALAEADAHLARLVRRRARDLPAVEGAPWDALREVAAAAEARRRAAAREARVEERLDDVGRRATKLAWRRVDVPDASSDAMPDADEAARALDEAEARLTEAERAEEAMRALQATLRDPALRLHRARSLAELEAEAARAVALEDASAATVALRALAPKAEALRAEAARVESAAKRARKAGRPAPRGEARAGDALDGYG